MRVDARQARCPPAGAPHASFSSSLLLNPRPPPPPGPCPRPSVCRGQPMALRHGAKRLPLAGPEGVEGVGGCGVCATGGQDASAPPSHPSAGPSPPAPSPARSTPSGPAPSPGGFGSRPRHTPFRPTLPRGPSSSASRDVMPSKPQAAFPPRPPLRRLHRAGEARQRTRGVPGASSPAGTGSSTRPRSRKASSHPDRPGAPPDHDAPRKGGDGQGVSPPFLHSSSPRPDMLPRARRLPRIAGQRPRIPPPRAWTPAAPGSRGPVEPDPLASIGRFGGALWPAPVPWHGRRFGGVWGPASPDCRVPSAGRRGWPWPCKTVSPGSRGRLAGGNVVRAPFGPTRWRRSLWARVSMSASWRRWGVALPRSAQAERAFQDLRDSRALAGAVLARPAGGTHLLDPRVRGMPVSRLRPPRSGPGQAPGQPGDMPLERFALGAGFSANGLDFAPAAVAAGDVEAGWREADGRVSWRSLNRVREPPVRGCRRRV